MTADVGLIAHRLQTVRYMQVVSATMLVTDWVMLFDHEVNFIWPGGWTLTKCLYLLSRYLPFLDTTLNLIYYLSPHISPHTCKWNYSTSTWSTAVGMSLTELILVIRTYAIYDRSRRILYIFGGLWIAWIAAGLPIVYFFTRSLQYAPPPHPDIPGCYVVEGSSIIFACFVVLLCFEILIVVLTLKKAVYHFRQRTTFGRNTLLTVLYRDGIVFFIMLAACSLGNVILLVSAPTEYLDLLDTFTRVTHSILCCRVLINLKTANASRSTVNTSSSSGNSGWRRRLGTSQDHSAHEGAAGPTPSSELGGVKPRLGPEAEVMAGDVVNITLEVRGPRGTLCDNSERGTES